MHRGIRGRLGAVYDRMARCNASTVVARLGRSGARARWGDSVAKGLLIRSVALACGGLASGVASAHHSIAGQFDLDKRGELNGVITDIDWVNPHIYIHLAVTDDSGAVTTWRVESLPVAMLRKAGLTKQMLIADGQRVTVEVLHARDGTQHLAYALRLVYADGHYYKLAAEAD
jgi:hypothetical protein